MKKRLFSFISIVVGFVIALAAVEVMAIGWLYLEDGRHTPAAELFERTQNTYVRDMTRGTGCRFIDTLYPHPYWAFVHHANPPCGISWANNVGLFGPDFPTVKPADRYVVMISGGSVAAYLGGNQKPPYPRYLEEELNKSWVSPNGKPWMVLDAAAGAWKEPQSFIAFAMYATAVDAVINLSGYNEHYYFQPKMDQRLEGPAANFLEANPFAADENFGDAAIGWVMGRLAGAMSINPILGKSHAAYLLIRGIEAAAKGKDSFKSSKRTTIPSLFALPKDIQDNPQRLFDVQLDLYQKYFRATEAVAHDNGVKSAYFMQPIPAWGKTLTDDGTARRRRPGLRRALSPHGRRHDDAQRARPADLRPGRYFQERHQHHLRRFDPLSRRRRRPQPRQPHGGGPDRRAAGQDLGPAAQALKGFAQFPEFPLPPLSHFWGACTASGIQTFRHSRYFRQRAKCGGKASPTMDWASQSVVPTGARSAEREGPSFTISDCRRRGRSLR